MTKRDLKHYHIILLTSLGSPYHHKHSFVIINHNMLFQIHYISHLNIAYSMQSACMIIRNHNKRKG
jgi:hypothetical protein